MSDAVYYSQPNLRLVPSSGFRARSFVTRIPRISRNSRPDLGLESPNRGSGRSYRRAGSPQPRGYGSRGRSPHRSTGKSEPGTRNCASGPFCWPAAVSLVLRQESAECFAGVHSHPIHLGQTLSGPVKLSPSGSSLVHAGQARSITSQTGSGPVKHSHAHLGLVTPGQT